MLDLADKLPDDKAARSIVEWARSRKLDVVVWTALSSNFAEEVKQPFSVAEAIAYLRRLSPEAKVKAAEYLWRAPGFISTPLRTAMEKSAWFPIQEGS